MRSLTNGHFKAGFDAIRGAKLRNFWTMLGVIIGVASVITIVGIGEGVKAQVSGQIHQLGNDLITIHPAQLKSGSNGTAVNELVGLNVTSMLTSKDVDTVTTVKGVGTSAPLTFVTGTLKGDGGIYKNGIVIGTSPDLSSLLNQSLAYGVFLTDNDIGSNAAVLGSNAAQALFNEDVPLGRTFSFRGQQFMVRGIFNEFNSTPLGQETDFNNAIFIPNDVAESMTKNTATTYEILAKPDNPHQTAAVAASIRRALDASHGGQSNLAVLEGNQNVGASDSILELLTTLIAGVAAISLLVGGVGIMNVMLVSVAERTHEIGIRKAVGATNRQILNQFMIESTVLSFTGGVIGILVAFLIDLVLRLLTNLQPLITWQLVALATGVSLLVGIIFGSIPALKAARKHPIDALRAE